MSEEVPRAVRVIGHRLVFRDAAVSDAKFIHSLRLDPAKNEFLSAVSERLDDQVAWLTNYAGARDQSYFVIETLDGVPCGTIRIYDRRGSSVSWGSWILTGDAPKSSAIESTMMLYRHLLDCGFNASHFDVRKGNEKVWQYHERLGAIRVAESPMDYHYEMPGNAIRAAIVRYEGRLPEGIRTEW